jgi:SDR family mycofactocin-dependent oxidoreductase
VAGRLAGRVAFITGAARGQGRAHALRLASEDADILAVDIAADMETVPYRLAGQADLDETGRAIRAVGGRVLCQRADVRSQAELDAAVAAGLDAFGRIDVVCANAGILSRGKAHLLSDDEFTDVIDVNLVGVWHTAKAAIPALIDAGCGGSIILTSSSAGLKGARNIGHYVAAKHGVVGLMKSLAVELAPHSIRVNAIAPSTVRTDMVINDAMVSAFRPDLESPTVDDATAAFRELNLLPVPWVEVSNVSDAVAWLASDESRFVTGTVLPVDAGALTK